MNTHRMAVIIGMILIATASTLLPHPPNFTPLAAIAMFGGAHLSDRRAAFLIPLGALILRDFIIGLHILMPAVYACYVVNVCLGLGLRENPKPLRIVGAALLGSIIFFEVTNFAVWLALGTFPRTTEGLVACYVAGIPYFKNTVASDLIYSLLMFGGFALAQSKIESLRPVTVK